MGPAFNALRESVPALVIPHAGDDPSVARHLGRMSVPFFFIGLMRAVREDRTI